MLPTIGMKSSRATSRPLLQQSALLTMGLWCGISILNRQELERTHRWQCSLINLPKTLRSADRAWKIKSDTYGNDGMPRRVRYASFFMSNVHRVRPKHDQFGYHLRRYSNVQSVLQTLRMRIGRTAGSTVAHVTRTFRLHHINVSLTNIYGEQPYSWNSL